VAKPKDSFDADQAAAQLTRGGNVWALDFARGAVVSYGFRDTIGTTPDVPKHNEESTFSRMTFEQVQAVQLALALWADVSGIRFEERGRIAGFSSYTNEASILFANYNDAGDGAGGFMSGPAKGNFNGSHKSWDGDVWIDLNIHSAVDVAYGGFHFETLLHEIGHAIGLDHPGNYNAGKGAVITYDKHAAYREDSAQYSLMSYFDETETGADYRGIKPSTPMLHDIAAIQLLYGANMSTRTGDTVYGSNSTADRDVFNFDINRAPVLTIWDAGGIDTLSIANIAVPGFVFHGQILDLRQGSFSSTIAFDAKGNSALLESNIAIAFGTVIENAIGSPGNDGIVGNEVANRLTGGGGDDTLLGREGDDWLDGGAGKDWLEGGIGHDLVDGGGDDDTMFGGDGNDVLRGDWGNDSIRGDAGDDSIDAGSGNDQVWGGAGRDTILGRSGDDRIFGDDGKGGGGNDVIDGGDGDDEIDGEGGNDTIRGGDGNDILRGGAGGDTIDGGEDDDQIEGDDGHDALDGGAGHDILRGGKGRDSLRGGDGNDALDGGADADDMRGGYGDDVYYVDHDDDTVSETVVIGSGPFALITDAGSIDEVRTTLNAYTLPLPFDSVVENLTFIGTKGSFFGTGNGVANRITGGPGVDILRGMEGDDVLVGNEAGDLLRGGEGNDTMIGGAGVDTFIGGPGDDLVWDLEAGDKLTELDGEGVDTVRTEMAVFTLPQYFENLTIVGTTGRYTGTGNAHDNLITGLGAGGISGPRFTLAGLGGNDRLIGGHNLLGDTLDGGAGDDVLEGLGGNDVLTGGPGADTLDGGNGNDTADYTNAAAGVALSLAGGGSGGEAAGDVFIDVENVDGSKYADTLAGDAGPNRLRGSAGNDVLDGGGGADTLDGGDGNDTLVTDGTDTLLGGAGIDTAFASAATIASGLTLAVLGTSSVERFVGNAGDDRIDGSGVAFALELLGNAGNDRLVGGDGGDRIEGGEGRNELIGGKGNDELIGGTLFDTFEGGEGNDILRGSGGQTSMFGGPGDDLMIGSLTSGNAMEAGTGNDTLIGGDFGDSLLDTTGGDDVMRGGGGNDTLVDYYGVNQLYGEGGNDFVVSSSMLGSLLDGGDGDDYLFSAFGGNRLVGGAGNDRLENQDGGPLVNLFEGGAGADVFVFRVGVSFEALVRVLDFELGIDLIGLRFDRYEDLRIVDGADGAVISFAGYSPMTLVGIAAADLTPDAFVPLS